jgi:hypothetical protein
MKKGCLFSAILVSSTRIFFKNSQLGHQTVFTHVRSVADTGQELTAVHMIHSTYSPFRRLLLKWFYWKLACGWCNVYTPCKFCWDQSGIKGTLREDQKHFFFSKSAPIGARSFKTDNSDTTHLPHTYSTYRQSHLKGTSRENQLLTRPYFGSFQRVSWRFIYRPLRIITT